MIKLLTGDVRDVLPTLADNSVQCVVTSPPYYALRSYLDASHPLFAVISEAPVPVHPVETEIADLFAENQT